MGDSIDNVAGVPGIGEKGARDSIATFGSLDALLAHAGDVTQKKYREGLLDPRRPGATEPRTGQDPDRRRDRRSIPRRSAIGGLERALLRAVRQARVPHAGHGVRADRIVYREGLRVVGEPRRARRARARELATPGGSRSASSPTGPRACAPTLVGLVVLHRASPGTLRAARHTKGSAGGASLDRQAALEHPAAGVREPADRASRPRSQGRRGRAGRPRHHACAASPSTRCWRVI